MLHRTSLLSFATIALVACGSSEKANAPVAVASPLARSYVLVHGAWMGAWAWDAVADRLRGQGANVTSVELPGHGADQTPVSGATLDAYVANVESAIDGRDNVVLVGHSMAGIVISQVAEKHPTKIARLVYLAAYVPKDRQTLQELAGTDATSHVGPALTIDPTHGVAAIARDKLQDIFCADCSPEAALLLAKNYRDEPLPAFAAPVRVTPTAWGQVPKFFIFTTQDHAVSYELQQRMTAGVQWAGTETLETGHAPFLSKPDAVAGALAKIAEAPVSP